MAIGFGVSIGYSTNSGVTYTTCASLTDITPPSAAVGKSKSTANDSPNRTHTYDFTLLDPGECELKLLYAKAQHAALYALLLTAPMWKITYNDGSTLVFTAFISDFGTPTPMEDQMETTIKLQVSGKPVFTAGT